MTIHKPVVVLLILEEKKDVYNKDDENKHKPLRTTASLLHRLRTSIQM
jgi:hypothetical protein